MIENILKPMDSISQISHHPFHRIFLHHAGKLLGGNDGGNGGSGLGRSRGSGSGSGGGGSRAAVTCHQNVCDVLPISA